MSTTIVREQVPATPATGGRPTAPATRGTPSLLFTLVAIAAIGGIGGAIYTYRTAAAESIVTPEDAVFPEVPVRGPLSLWAQSDIITYHQLDRTGGQRYAEMERMVPLLDEQGEVVLDEAGEPIMVDNPARASWINATALTTVLGLGILSYAFSAFAVAVGLIMIGLGVVVFKLRQAIIA